MLTYVKHGLLNCFFVMGLLGLVSCSSDPSPELDIESVSIYTEPDTNQNSAIEVDLVLVYDEELVKILSRMSAAKYFATSNQLLLDNPTLLDIWHWELVPGQIVQNFVPPQEQGSAFAAFVFANYLTPGDHRIKVAPQGIVKILLMKNDLKNIAIPEFPQFRSGTTASNGAAASGGVVSETSCGKKLGLIRRPKAPRCLKVPCGPPPQPCPIASKTQSVCSPQYRPQGKPMPIISRPLTPCLNSAQSPSTPRQRMSPTQHYRASHKPKLYRAPRPPMRATPLVAKPSSPAVGTVSKPCQIR